MRFLLEPERWFNKQSYTFLLSSLGMFLLIPPFLTQHDLLRHVILILLANIIWIGSVILFADTKYKRIGVVVFVIILLLAVFDQADEPLIDFVRELILLIFFLAITRKLLLGILHSKRVTISVILGAVSVYLLLGLSGALLFQLIEIVYPGSFNVDVEFFNFYNMIYFSFVTMSTLGYGDILPMTAQARSVAILVSITGQLFLAILMAMLVGKFLADLNHERK